MRISLLAMVAFGITAASAGNPQCNPKTWSHYDSSCCTVNNPCWIGEGDCDKDSECMDGLVCGKDNCEAGKGFDAKADCCHADVLQGYKLHNKAFCSHERGEQEYSFEDAVMECNADEKCWFFSGICADNRFQLCHNTDEVSESDTSSKCVFGKENIFGCSGGKIALKSAGNKKYVYASKSGKKVYANQKDIATYETYTVEELGGDKIALISFHGKYLVAESGTCWDSSAGKDSYNINADRLERKSYETFTVEHHAGGTIALKTAHKRYVGLTAYNTHLCGYRVKTDDLRANSKKVGTNEKFSVECQAIDYSCKQNDWDSRQYCLCKPGYKLRDFESYHDNVKEDRRWTLRCEKINPKFAVEESYYPNRVEWTNWDAPINYVFANQDLYSGFLVGMESFHDNGKEDRRFIFFYTKINRDIYQLKDCKWKKMNNWDAQMNFKLTDNQVYGGIKSEHDNQKEDREWYAYVCNLEKRKK